MIKNNYIHTTTCNVSTTNEVYQKPIFDHSKTCLISLIHALSSNSFGIDTTNKGCEDIRRYKNKYLSENIYPFILDSGGYSIIAGDVQFLDIVRFIECYNHALKVLKDDFDYVFSLDIPVFINSPEKNTINIIGALNEKSLNTSIESIEANPILIEKFSLVLQWKMKGQYYIWDKLYEDLHLKNYVKNYAVGGLVGLLGLCPHIDFAPFIGPCFYWLYRYLEKDDFTHPLFIHILGQYHKSARFILFFLQELFNNYLKLVNQTCIITFDTINYSLSSMYKTRVGVDVYINEYPNLHVYHCYELTDVILSKIYTSDNSLKSFHDNWDTIKKDEPLKDTSFLIPTYIYSQLQLDNYFEQVIKSKNLIDIFRSRDHISESEIDKLKKLKWELSSHLNFLTPNFKKTVLKSIQLILAFHGLVIYKGFDKKYLDDLMFKFISKINFPFDLQ
jgi:hypothetical protein